MYILTEEIKYAPCMRKICRINTKMGLFGVVVKEKMQKNSFFLKKRLTNRKSFAKMLSILKTFERKIVTLLPSLQRAVGRCETVTRVWRIHSVSRGLKANYRFGFASRLYRARPLHRRRVELHASRLVL